MMKMRKIALLALTVALLPPLAAFGASYSDMDESHWAHAAVSAMSEAGVIAGFPDGSFQPSEIVTHGEFIKMAYLASGGAEPEAAAAGQNWALPYYEASIGAGLFTAYDIDRSALPYAIPRGLMALILSNILGETEIENYGAIQGSISDVSAATENEFHIVKVYAEGLITGYPDGTFKPGGTLTRAEAATVIWRLGNADIRQKPVEVPVATEAAIQGPSGQGALIERVEDFAQAGSHNPLQKAIANSTVTKPISDIVDGPVTYFGEPVLYYEILEGYSYKMKRVPNLLNMEMIAIGYKGASGLLIKDRKVIAELDFGQTSVGEYTVSIGGTNESDYKYTFYNYGTAWKSFPDFDYIAVVEIDFAADANIGAALLIPNTL
jgi:hypothetical protein